VIGKTSFRFWRELMRLGILAEELKTQDVPKVINPNAVRLGVLTSLLGLISLALVLSSLISCKSTSKSSKFDAGQTPNPDNSPDLSLAELNAVIKEPSPAAPPEIDPTVTKGNETQPELITPSVVLPVSASDPALDMESLGEPKVASGAVVGLEVWQNNRPVTTIETGKQVHFKLAGWSRETSSSEGCDENPGLVQASWTIGSNPAADVQRFAGQDCQSLDYGGMFTKEGLITVKLTVSSIDGNVASTEKTFLVKNPGTAGHSPD
jgi:hypothetical protein